MTLMEATKRWLIALYSAFARIFFKDSTGKYNSYKCASTTYWCAWALFMYIAYSYFKGKRYA